MAIIRKTFSVSDISIRVSADSIEKRVCSLSGVRNASVSVENQTMTVEFDDDLTSANRIIQAVREAGYQAYLKESENLDRKPDEIQPVIGKTG